MKYIKFIVLHVILDIFFVVGLCYAYLYGAAGSVIIREIPLGVMITIIIIIGVRNFNLKKPFESIGDIVLTIAMFMLYVWATKDNYDILASNIWFIRLLRGIILIACFYLVLELVKNFLSSFVKSGQIYYVACNNEDASVIDCLVGASFRFKYTIAIPVFNKIIRNCINEIVNTAKKEINNQSGEDTSNDSNTLSAIFSGLENSKILKAPKLILKMYTDYVDECVLAYCYANPDRSMLKSAAEAIGIFLSHGFKIIEKMSVVVILQVLLKIGVIIGSIMTLISVKALTLNKIIIIIIIFKVVDFIIQDAIIEPMLMQSILSTFIKYDAEKGMANNIIEKFPILNKIKKLQGVSEKDDVNDDNDMQNAEVNESAEVNTESHEKPDADLDAVINSGKENEAKKERETLL